MKVRKEVWYVVALAVIIVLIILAFGDKINFSPGEKTVSKIQEVDIIKDNWIENIDNLGISIGGSEEFLAKLSGALRGDGLILIQLGL